MRNIDSDNLNKNELKVTETLPYGENSLDDTNNTLIMNAPMEFLIAFKGFDSMCLLFRENVALFILSILVTSF